MRRLLLATPVLLLSLVVPAGAGAATVTTECAVKGCFAVGALVVADPGEANRIRVTGTRDAVEVTDAGAPLRAGEGCTATDAGAIRCADVFAVRVSAGDGGDVVEVTVDADMGGARLEGGLGDDVLTGGDTPDSLDGGGGRDRLAGGASDDTLADGDARSAPDADVIDGGPGRDVVDYSARRRDVAVRADRSGTARDAGEAGEGDVLTGIDGAYGGAGDDVLRASDAGAVSVEVDGGLVGGPGDDLLIGGRGGDAIDASEGDDRVRAGAGSDSVILSYGRRGARVDCGRGYDDVTLAGPRDVLASCEEIEPEQFFGTFTRVALGRGAVRLKRNEAERLRVAVRVDAGRHAGALIARRTFGDRTGRLAVTPLARRLARRGARPRLRVTVLDGPRRISGFRLAP